MINWIELPVRVVEKPYANPNDGGFLHRLIDYKALKADESIRDLMRGNYDNLLVLVDGVVVGARYDGYELRPAGVLPTYEMADVEFSNTPTHIAVIDPSTLPA